MNRTKFLGKMLCLALVAVMVVSMVPSMNAKARELVSKWIKVTDENIADLDGKLTDLNTLGDELDGFLKAITDGGQAYIMYLNDVEGYYIVGKQGDTYKCLYRKTYEYKDVSLSEIQKGEHNYYFYPQYTVTLDLNGGSLESGDTTVTTIAGLLVYPTPVKEGYLFTGWFDDQAKRVILKTEVYMEPNVIKAHWIKDTDVKWVRATSISDLENASLPICNADRLYANIDRYQLPEDADFGVVAGTYVDYDICYLYAFRSSYDGEMHIGYYPDKDKLEEDLSTRTIYVIENPDAETPATPAPADPEPTTPADPEPTTPATLAPATPAPATPAPVTPAPVTEESDDTSSDTDTPAPAPVLKTTNLAGEQIVGWDAITKLIATQTKDKQQNVSGANQDLLHVDASEFDKTIPAATVKAVSSSALRGLHVFIGNSDAVTFLAKTKLSGYKETNFDHKDTVTDHTRTIEFTNKQALGTTVTFHTTVPVKNGTVTVYKVDANGRTRIATTVSNANGQVCFPITETATYVLEY